MQRYYKFVNLTFYIRCFFVTVTFFLQFAVGDKTAGNVSETFTSSIHLQNLLGDSRVPLSMFILPCFSFRFQTNAD